MNLATSISTSPSSKAGTFDIGWRNHPAFVIPASQTSAATKDPADMFNWLESRGDHLSALYELADNEHPVLGCDDCRGMLQLESGNEIRVNR